MLERYQQMPDWCWTRIIRTSYDAIISPVSRGSSAHHDRHRPAGSDQCAERRHRTAGRRRCRPVHAGPDRPSEAVLDHASAGHSDQRCEGAHRSAAPDDRGGLPVRRGDHPPRRHRDRVLLRQTGWRPGPVRARPRDRRGADRRGSERHRQALGEALLGRGLGRPERTGDPGDRGLRRGVVGPQGEARAATAGEAARQLPGLGEDVQHLRRVPAHPDRAGERERGRGPGSRASAGSN